MSEFISFPKIPRSTSGEMITITEKLDGTNACIIVESAGLVENHYGDSFEKFTFDFSAGKWGEK